MTAPRRVLLLIGSPRKTTSTSLSLGSYLLDRMREQKPSLETEIVFVYTALKHAGELVAAVERADLVILATPTYTDSLPANVTRALEILAERRTAAGGPSFPPRPSFVPLINCGYPEVRHTDVAFAICRRFTVEAGFAWVGGLVLGQGELIHGLPLDRLGRKVRNVRAALDLTAAALAAGEPVPARADALMRKPPVPRWLYKLVANLRWYRESSGFGTLTRLKDRPHQD